MYIIFLIDQLIFGMLEEYHSSTNLNYIVQTEYEYYFFNRSDFLYRLILFICYMSIGHRNIFDI